MKDLFNAEIGRSNSHEANQLSEIRNQLELPLTRQDVNERLEDWTHTPHEAAHILTALPMLK